MRTYLDLRAAWTLNGLLRGGRLGWEVSKVQGWQGLPPPLDFSCMAMKGGGVEVVPRLPPPKPLLSIQACKGVCSKSRSKKDWFKKN